MTDVVFTFSTETLADAGAREFCRPPDQALLALLGSPRVTEVVVADPWRSRPALALRAAQGRSSVAVDLPSHARHVRPLRWRRRDPLSGAALRHAYRSYDRVLARAARPGSVLVTFHPFVAAYCPAAWARRTVFYARDDWSTFPPLRPWWPRLREAYALIAERGTPVCAVSQEIAGRIGSSASLVIPNGIDAALWAGPEPALAAPDVQGPRVVYAGTVDSRLDVDAVLQVAADPGVGSVLVAGPLADENIAARLRQEPSVHLLGRLGQADLVALLRSADVCLLAHRRTPLTEAMSPLKLYEYLASGRAVVATDLPPIRAAGEDVVLVAEGGDYAGAVRQALRQGPLDEPSRLELVARHSWQRRHEQLLDFALTAP